MATPDGKSRKKKKQDVSLEQNSVATFRFAVESKPTLARSSKVRNWEKFVVPTCEVRGWKPVG